jgi:intracellular multiplication protein IcmB
MLKRDIFSMVDIEANDNLNPYNFIRSDGGFVTFVEIKGSPKLIGSEEFHDRLHYLIDRTSGAMKKQGQRIEFFFMRDPTAGQAEIRSAQNECIKSAETLDLDANYIFKARERILGKKIAKERTFMVIHTTPQSLPPAVMNRESKKRLKDEQVKELGLRPGVRGQSPFISFEALRKPHDAFVDNLIQILQQQLIVEKIDAHKVIRSIRQIYAPNITGEDYRPYLLGDKIPARFVNEFPSEADMSWLMQPAIADQLFPFDIDVCKEDDSIVDVGGSFFAPLTMELGPQQYKPFSELFDMIDGDIPWCIKVAFDTGSDSITSKLNTKKSMALLLALTSRKNKEIKRDIDQLLNTSPREPKVSASVSFCCWSSIGTTHTKSREEAIDAARKAREITTQAIQSWGSPDVRVERGDAVDLFIATMPGLKRKAAGAHFPAVLGDILGISPITRPASPYDQGSMLFTTLDHKLWPYAVGSSKQTMHIDLIYARPGSGKSVLMGVKNLALLTKPGLEGLMPRISCIDIGFSSALFIEQVKNMLPEHKRHLLMHCKLQNSTEFAINLFDTPLGCDRPFPTDRALISNLLSLILAPAEGGAIDGLAQLTSTLVDEVYSAKIKQPNKYERYMDDQVDKALDLIDFKPDHDTLWYEVRDELFQAGMIVEANLAHRFVTPTLADASAVLSQSDTIREIFGEARLNGGEPLIKACQRQLLSASKDFPIINGQTKFTTENARIVALDLMDVSPQGGSSEQRQTSIMYLLAFNLLTKEFFRKKDVVQFIPKMYKKHHEKIIEGNSMVPAHLCMDEFHRSSAAEQVRANVKMVMREGRKFGVMVTLCSQRETDFDRDMVEMATNIWVLDKGTKKSRDYIREVFAPSEDALRHLELFVNGPSAQGANLLYLGVNKGGNIEQLLNLKLTPHELWSLSTTPADVKVRDRLIDNIGYGAAIEALADRFPSGTCMPYLESVKTIAKKDMKAESTDEDMAAKATNDLVRELAETHLKEHA